MTEDYWCIDVILPLYFFRACSNVYSLVGLTTSFLVGGEDIDLPKKYKKYGFKLKPLKSNCLLKVLHSAAKLKKVEFCEDLSTWP